MSISTTERLLDAAEYRMRRGGYNAVSFRDLANDAEIKSSSVHYHFPKKEDLGVALVKRYSERFFEGLAEITGEKASPMEKLLGFRSVYRTALVEDDAICLCGLLGAETPGLPPVLAAEIQAFFKANIKWVAEALPEALTPEEKQKIAENFVATHQGAMMLATSLNEQSLFDSITEHHITMTLHNF